MTPEQQLHIRAELARRMGWQVFPYVMPSKNGQWETLLCPPGERVHISTVIEPPDPFTNAADNREMVAWICANDYKSAFGDELLKLIGIRDRFLGDVFPAEFHIADILIAPLETITLCAYIAVTGDRTYGI